MVGLWHMMEDIEVYGGGEVYDGGVYDGGVEV